jgi:hypothetical protein
VRQGKGAGWHKRIKLNPAGLTAREENNEHSSESWKRAPAVTETAGHDNCGHELANLRPGNEIAARLMPPNRPKLNRNQNEAQGLKRRPADVINNANAITTAYCSGSGTTCKVAFSMLRASGTPIGSIYMLSPKPVPVSFNA